MNRLHLATRQVIPFVAAIPLSIKDQETLLKIAILVEQSLQVDAYQWTDIHVHGPNGTMSKVRVRIGKEIP